MAIDQYRWKRIPAEDRDVLVFVSQVLDDDPTADTFADRRKMAQFLLGFYGDNLEQRARQAQTGGKLEATETQGDTSILAPVI